MRLSRIHLELARSKEHPDGDPHFGYEFVAPLDANGLLDAKAWQEVKGACMVRHFAPGQDDENGRLIHRGKGWIFDYDNHDTDDDEPVFKLDKHTIKQGEYLSITEHDGITRTFKIATVRPLA
ncbi:MAG: hypothetical protein GC190_20600 [Alphaproteobacteria bacterium]|nr:hypothetical protein [Alphaproteobacteria bacterium]